MGFSSVHLCSFCTFLQAPSKRTAASSEKPGSFPTVKTLSLFPFISNAWKCCLGKLAVTAQHKTGFCSKRAGVTRNKRWCCCSARQLKRYNPVQSALNLSLLYQTVVHAAEYILNHPAGADTTPSISTPHKNLGRNARLACQPTSRLFRMMGYKLLEKGVDQP